MEFFTIFIPKRGETMTDQSAVAVPASASTSFLTRATNVFASPGELYGELGSNPPQTASWLIPFIFSLILALVFTFALYNNPSLRQEIYDMQSRGMQKAV